MEFYDSDDEWEFFYLQVKTSSLKRKLHELDEQLERERRGRIRAQEELDARIRMQQEMEMRAYEEECYMREVYGNRNHYGGRGGAESYWGSPTYLQKQGVPPYQPPSYEETPP